MHASPADPSAERVCGYTAPALMLRDQSHGLNLQGQAGYTGGTWGGFGDQTAIESWLEEGAMVWSPQTRGTRWGEQPSVCGDSQVCGGRGQVWGRSPKEGRQGGAGRQRPKGGGSSMAACRAGR